MIEDQFVEHHVEAQLVGGPLDGDKFIMAPVGSIMPTSQLRYPSESNIDGAVCPVWLVYQVELVPPEWTAETINYKYIGRQSITNGTWYP